MKKLLISALTVAMLGAVPAFGQTMPLIIKHGTGDRVTTSAPTTFEERLDIAVEDACEKPFIRDLNGRRFYVECLAEARAQADAILAERASAVTTELALR